jgi:hypothetical protein
MAEPSLTIVLAAWPDTAGLAECLEALATQRAEAEVIVASTYELPADLTVRFPWARHVRATTDCLIPHLWGLGMARAKGDVVAITTTQFTPAPDWATAIRSAHARLESPAVGGVIEPPCGAGPLAWATFFLRYSAYLGWRQEAVVADLPGDNASYKRRELDAEELIRDGFWEPDHHRRLRAEGKDLVFVPAIRVMQQRSFGFRRFLGQRLRHGMEFGRSRLRGRGPLYRTLAVAASPLIPVVLLTKIVRRVVRGGRHYGPFLCALPALMCFLLAWSAGEALGYMFASGLAPRAVLERGGVSP